MGRSSYYYFVASLPMVQWGAKCPMTGEEFLLSAKRLLQAQDYALIEKLLQDHGGDLATDNDAARLREAGIP
ncbi:MAG TPA: hypothetical protein PKV41_01575, partial [Candidatus Omnitrophota bacterium]|nr:hypothetical protein [Candidatus Omnitrophota bacterium]